MTIAGEGRDPNRQHMVKLAKQSDVSKCDADAIIAEVQAVISHWPDCAAEADVSKATAQQIAKSLP